MGVALLLCACGQPEGAPATVTPLTASPTAPPIAPATAGPTAVPAPQEPAAPPYELTLAPAAVAVGEQLVATVIRRSVTQGNCRFLAYDMTLREVGDDTPHVTFLSPERLGPPAPTTGVYTLTATLAGETTLVASIYGETDCGGGFSWATQQSNTVEIIIGAARQAYLPRLLR